MPVEYTDEMAIIDDRLESVVNALTFFVLEYDGQEHKSDVLNLVCLAKELIGQKKALVEKSE